ncbi:hypothetical protein ASG57_32615 [Bradyrhizobium sp. Leaf396]|jgi:hypothetical protein|nr:hypothetical protein ASG57_32615 [Bradyrhizobium sp. Leaf396]
MQAAIDGIGIIAANRRRATSHELLPGPTATARLQNSIRPIKKPQFAFDGSDRWGAESASNTQNVSLPTFRPSCQKFEDPLTGYDLLRVVKDELAVGLSADRAANGILHARAGGSALDQIPQPES